MCFKISQDPHVVVSSCIMQAPGFFLYTNIFVRQHTKPRLLSEKIKLELKILSESQCYALLNIENLIKIGGV